jgi:ABC-type uncharacterized transport system auxiliary subunit
VSTRATFAALFLAAAGLLSGCFGARPTLRSYYVLYGEPDTSRDYSEEREQAKTSTAAFKGLVRVRNLNAEDIYEKFQIVVRRSPYELRYSDTNVWAVKPDNMVSDIIARTLLESETFSGVTRELGDTRPDYTLGGDLRAIEVYDSNDLWYAHVALSMTLTRFSNGERMWTFTFDERKIVPSTSFSHAVRTMSELLRDALERAIGELRDIASGKPPPRGGKEDPRLLQLEKRDQGKKEEPPPPTIEDEHDPEDEPLFVPEGDRSPER